METFTKDNEKISVCILFAKRSEKCLEFKACREARAEAQDEV
ncbi:4722_t:CDS:1, partial [Funneliformis geosporum]